MSPRALTDAEASAVIRRLASPHRELAVFIVNTGARIREALELTPADVDRQHRWVTFQVTKGGHGPRRVPLNGAAREALRVQVGRQRLKLLGLYDRRDWRLIPIWSRVAPERPATAYTPRAFQKALARAASAAGVGRVTPHALRHTFATWLIEEGVSLRHVQELLGHRSIRSTQIYTHPTPDGLIRAVRSVEWGESLTRRQRRR